MASPSTIWWDARTSGELPAAESGMGAHLTGVRGMHPPFSFPAGKENGPCTVQKKSAFGGPTLSPWDKVGRRESVVRCATRSGASSAECAGLGTGVGVLRRIWGRGCKVGVVDERLLPLAPCVPLRYTLPGPTSKNRPLKYTASIAQAALSDYACRRVSEANRLKGGSQAGDSGEHRSARQ